MPVNIQRHPCAGGSSDHCRRRAARGRTPENLVHRRSLFVESAPSSSLPVVGASAAASPAKCTVDRPKLTASVGEN